MSLLGPSSHASMVSYKAEVSHRGLYENKKFNGLRHIYSLHSRKTSGRRNRKASRSSLAVKPQLCRPTLCRASSIANYFSAMFILMQRNATRPKATRCTGKPRVDFLLMILVIV